MGHDISAYLSKTTYIDEYDEENCNYHNEIAYLRRGAYESYENKIEIYAALKSKKFYAGCSGDGQCKEYKHKNIKNALNHAIKNNMKEDVIVFLKKCNDVLSDQSITSIIIKFG